MFSTASDAINWMASSEACNWCCTQCFDLDFERKNEIRLERGRLLEDGRWPSSVSYPVGSS